MPYLSTSSSDPPLADPRGGDPGPHVAAEEVGQPAVDLMISITELDRLAARR